jgi:hypothetical protein
MIKNKCFKKRETEKERKINQIYSYTQYILDGGGRTVEKNFVWCFIIDIDIPSTNTGGKDRTGSEKIHKKLLLQTYRFNIKFKKILNKLFLPLYASFTALEVFSFLILMFPITLKLLLSCEIFCQSNTSLYV